MFCCACEKLVRVLPYDPVPAIYISGSSMSGRGEEREEAEGANRALDLPTKH